MKKNIAISILTLTTSVSGALGYFQWRMANHYRVRAEKAEMMALEMQNEAAKQRAIALENMKLAEANAAEAIRQEQLAQAELKRLRGNR